MLFRSAAFLSTPLVIDGSMAEGSASCANVGSTMFCAANRVTLFPNDSASTTESASPNCEMSVFVSREASARVTVTVCHPDTHAGTLCPHAGVAQLAEAAGLGPACWGFESLRRHVHINDLPTPAVVIDIEIMRRNLDAMVAVHPGHRLRPHVKAHKSSGIAAEQVLKGHNSFTCATPREILGLVKAGVGNDLLLANETVDPQRLAALAAVQDDALITVAVDSRDTLDAADRAGIRNVLIDVNVGLPRCGIAPQDAGWLADSARVRGITVRGVMGYEGHLMMVADRDEKKQKVHDAMALLATAHADVGGDIVSAGGTGTYEDRKSTRLNSSHIPLSRMPSSA